MMLVEQWRMDPGLGCIVNYLFYDGTVETVRAAEALETLNFNYSKAGQFSVG